MAEDGQHTDAESPRVRLVLREARNEWSALGLGLRTLSLVLVGLGGACALMGFLGDFFGWWDNLPFSTNFLSGATGACFGIPFATLILKYLSRRQDEEAQQRRTRRLRSAALLDLDQAAHPFLNLDEIESIAMPVLRLHATADHIAKATASFVEQGRSTEVTRGEFRKRIQAYLDQVEAEWVALAGHVPWGGHLTRDWVNLVDKWRFINDHVKPRVFEENMTWLDDETYVELQALLYETGMPLTIATGLADKTVRRYLESIEALLAKDQFPTFSDLNSAGSPLLVGLGPYDVDEIIAQSASVTKLRSWLAHALEAYGLRSVGMKE